MAHHGSSCAPTPPKLPGIPMAVPNAIPMRWPQPLSYQVFLWLCLWLSLWGGPSLRVTRYSSGYSYGVAPASELPGIPMAIPMGCPSL